MLTAAANRVLARALPRGVPVARQALRRGLDHVFGPPPFERRPGHGDAGLFGPGSASWRVVGEPAAIVGGLRGLVVQLLHPGAMAGVADHSRFREDALGRLQRTAGYVTTVTFGSTAEVLAVSRRVRRTHGPVRGVDPHGRPYAADDPRLLAWVSIALTSSFLATDRAYAPTRVDPDTADAFVAEQSRAAALLDPRVDLDAIAADPERLAALRTGTLALPLVAEGTLPTTVGELDAALDAFQPELAVTHQGREAFRFLAWPALPAPIRTAYLPLFAGALATLRPDHRRLLPIPGPWVWAPAARTNTLLVLTAMRATSGRSPSVRAAEERLSGGDGAA